MCTLACNVGLGTSVYACLYMDIHIYIHTYIYIYISMAELLLYIHKFKFLLISLCIYAYTYLFRLFVCVCVCVFYTPVWRSEVSVLKLPFSFYQVDPRALTQVVRLWDKHL